MGLDITAYTKLVAKPDAERDEDGYPVDYDHHNKFSANPDFPGRMDGIDSNMIYSYEDSMGFRTGSYGGYNGWRAALARLAGYEPEAAWAGEADGLPFVELVNFSDCEGTIGPVVARKLASDFAAFDSKAKDMGEDFYDRYSKWREAFDMASDNGAVSFH